MKRFLSTTAIVLTMTGAAFAEAHSEGFGNVAVEQTDFLASDLIGMRIYNSEAEVDAATPVANGAEQEWDDIGEAAPAVLAMIAMPLTYSISNGIAMAFITYALIKIGTGKVEGVSPAIWVVAVLSVVSFAV